ADPTNPNHAGPRQRTITPIVPIDVSGRNLQALHMADTERRRAGRRSGLGVAIRQTFRPCPPQIPPPAAATRWYRISRPRPPPPHARDPHRLPLADREFPAPAPLLPTLTRPPTAGQACGPARPLLDSARSSSNRPPPSNCQTTAVLRSGAVSALSSPSTRSIS